MNESLEHQSPLRSMEIKGLVITRRFDGEWMIGVKSEALLISHSNPYGCGELPPNKLSIYMT